MEITARQVFGAVALGGAFLLAGHFIAAWPQWAAGRELTVTGEGRATVRPDIAVLNLGVQIEPQPTADAALAQLESKFNAVLAAVEKAGIARDDITTANVSVNPVYDFSAPTRDLRGYEASQSITVKIRQLDSTGAIIAAATAAGATQVGGIQFDVDNPDAFTAEAQQEALSKATAEAERLSSAVGVRLGRVKTFNVSVSGEGSPPILLRAEQASGGDLQTPSGTQDITVVATITYQIW